MTRLTFFLHTALNHLRHGGQRALVALLCVAFGSMALVAMMMLSGALERVLVTHPQDIIGADISMTRAAEEYILPEDLRGLDELRGEGLLDEYTAAAYTSTLTFRKPGSSELLFPGSGIGIDPAAYPPLGELTVESPDGSGLSALLREPGDVLVTQDLALEYKLQTGDRLTLADLNTGAPLQATVRGIITDTPNHQGSKIYYNLETGARLAGGQLSLNTVLATAPDPDAAQARLQAGGWRAYQAAQLAAGDAEVQDLFAIVLNGAGVLGLLVSGVGIANTMQVLLRRRRREVAIWKSMGYRSSDLLILFALEAGLLGLAGSLLGAGIGVAVSAGLVELFSRTSTLLIEWQMSSALAPVALAVLVGVITTVVFALWAIVNSSRVAPVTLLRDEPGGAARMPWYQALALTLALAAPFTAVISLVMGSLQNALLVLLVALGGLVGLGIVLGGLLWVFTRLLPLRGAPLLNMARGNLRRRGLSPVFAIIALFVGVVALSVAAVVTQNADRVMGEKAPPLEGANLIVLAPAGETGSVHAALDGLGLESLSAGSQTRVRGVRPAGAGEEYYTPLLIGREQPGDYQISGAPWGSRPDGVYTAAVSGVPAGASLEVTLWDGGTRVLPVVGTYQVDFERAFRPELGVLMPDELSRSIAPPDQAQFYARVAPARLEQAAEQLGADLPGATVINVEAYLARFSSTYRNVFIFALAMGSLALLAGVLLMANSVSLAMLDRRFEIGVLKAMGYSRGHVLVTLVVEYLLIALVASGAGLALTRGFLWLMARQNTMAAQLLVMTPEVAAAVLLASLALTAATVLAVTWKPTRVSPLVILNDRE